MIVADQLHRAAALYGEAVAAICDDEHRTYAEIESRTNRLANGLLGWGLQPGDRVATLLENSIRCVEVDFGLAKAGLVRVSLNPRLTAREGEYVLEDSDATVLLADASFDSTCAEIVPRLPQLTRIIRINDGAGREAAATAIDYEAFLRAAADHAPGVRVDPEDLYCLFYTSGTTGRPKGVMLSHRAILQVSYNLLMEVGPWTTGEKILLMQPMSHGAGFFVLPYYLKGGAVVIMRQFDPQQVLRLAAQHRIETIKLVPTMLQRILRLPGLENVDLPLLRQIIYGASPMPTEPLRKAIEIFGPRLIQVYGQSECPVTLTILPLNEHRPDNPHPERLASAGRPWTTVEARIVDNTAADVAAGEIGELILRGPHLMSGYWKRPDLTAETVRNGWLHTRDMARKDANGIVYLLGRKDEMIISGGYNIAPREVEDVLYQHAAVQEAAVVGEPDAEWGQAVAAYLALKQPDAPVEEIMAFAKSLLGFKRPKRCYVVAELPKNSTGKIQKSALKPSLAVRAPWPSQTSP